MSGNETCKDVNFTDLPLDILKAIGVHPLSMGDRTNADGLAKIIANDEKSLIEIAISTIRENMIKLKVMNDALISQPADENLKNKFDVIKVKICRGDVKSEHMHLEISFLDDKILDIIYKTQKKEGSITFDEIKLEKRLICDKSNFLQKIHTQFINLVVGAYFYDKKKNPGLATKVNIVTSSQLYGENDATLIDLINLPGIKKEFKKTASAYGLHALANDKYTNIVITFLDEISAIKNKIETAFAFEKPIGAGGLKRSLQKNDTSHKWTSKGTRFIQGKERSLYTKNNGKCFYIKQKENGKMIYTRA